MAGGIQKSGARTLTWGTIPSNVPSLLRDLPILLAALAFFYAILSMTHYWMTPAGAPMEIHLEPSALPRYAMFSVLRIAAAYMVSLAFTLVYGYVAAYNARAEKIMVPLLDTLQSIPVLSFLPGVMVAMVALFPTKQIGRGAGLHSADFHRASVEHDVQFLFVAEKYSARDARGRRNLPLELVATVHADGAALFDHRAGVEFDDVRGGRLVFPDGLRNVRAGRSRFAPAGPRLLPADRRERGKHACDLVGHGSDDRNHRGD